MSMLMSAKLDDMTCRHDDTYYHRHMKSTPRAYCMRIASCSDLAGACFRLHLKTGHNHHTVQSKSIPWPTDMVCHRIHWLCLTQHTQQAILLPASQVDAPRAGHCA